MELLPRFILLHLGREPDDSIVDALQVFLAEFLVRLRLRQRLGRREHISNLSATQDGPYRFGFPGDILHPPLDVFLSTRVLGRQLIDIALPDVFFLLECKRREVHGVVTSR